MFNRNTFFSHTTNTSNNTKITNAGVKAPFSMNEERKHGGLMKYLLGHLQTTYGISPNEVKTGHASMNDFLDDVFDDHSDKIVDALAPTSTRNQEGIKQPSMSHMPEIRRQFLDHMSNVHAQYTPGVMARQNRDR